MVCRGQATELNCSTHSAILSGNTERDKGHQGDRATHLSLRLRISPVHRPAPAALANEHLPPPQTSERHFHPLLPVSPGATRAEIVGSHPFGGPRLAALPWAMGWVDDAELEELGEKFGRDRWHGGERYCKLNALSRP
jgi:hypothetical protein